MTTRCGYDGSLPFARPRRRGSWHRHVLRAALQLGHMWTPRPVRAWAPRLAALLLIVACRAAVPADVAAAGIWPGQVRFPDSAQVEQLLAKAREAAEAGAPATALAILHPVAEAGNAPAQAELGALYLQGVPRGTGIRPDYQRAERWLTAAAAANLPDAQFRLATLLESRTLPGSTTAALRWLRRAAEAGHAPAQSRLADMLAEGRGIAQDDAEAVQWLNRAAAQGNAEARGRLGAMYLRGRGVPQDFAVAAEWLGAAAEQGDAAAQGLLGTLYAHGRGVAVDQVAAHQWLNLSAATARDIELRTRSAMARDVVAARMSVEEIAEAQRRARDWRPAQSVAQAGSQKVAVR